MPLAFPLIIGTHQCSRFVILLEINCSLRLLQKKSTVCCNCGEECHKAFSTFCATCESYIKSNPNHYPFAKTAVQKLNFYCNIASLFSVDNKGSKVGILNMRNMPHWSAFTYA